MKNKPLQLPFHEARLWPNCEARFSPVDALSRARGGSKTYLNIEQLYIYQITATLHRVTNGRSLVTN